MFKVLEYLQHVCSTQAPHGCFPVRYAGMNPSPEKPSREVPSLRDRAPASCTTAAVASPTGRSAENAAIRTVAGPCRRGFRHTHQGAQCARSHQHAATTRMQTCATRWKLFLLCEIEGGTPPAS